MGCIARLGCLTLLFLLGIAALTVFLVTRPVGPRYADGAYRYEASGKPVEVRLSTEAARAFDRKLSGDLPRAEVLTALTRGVTVSEAELNSRVAEEVAALPLDRFGARVERVFIRLYLGRARAFIYTRTLGTDVTLQSDVAFTVERGRVTVDLSDLYAGRLRVEPLVSPLLSAIGEADSIERSIAVVIPPQVRDIRIEEGQLRAVLIGATGAP